MPDATEQHTAELYTSLQQHLGKNPRSPMFARLAQLYLDDGLPASALKLSLDGIEYHSDYPTGLLVIAKAQAMLRKYNDARETLEHLLHVLPSCISAKKILESLDQVERKYPPDGSLSSEISESGNLNPPSGRRRRRNWSWNEDLIPGLAAIDRSDEDSIYAETPLTHLPDPEVRDDEIDSLADRLEQVKMPPLTEPEHPDQRTEIKSPSEAETIDSGLVTETLAQIYVEQGRYIEAIEAYRNLRESNRDRSKEFTARIAELRVLLNEND